MLLQQCGLKKAFYNESGKVHGAICPGVVPGLGEAIGVIEAAIRHGTQLRRPQFSLFKYGIRFRHMPAKTYWDYVWLTIAESA